MDNMSQAPVTEGICVAIRMRPLNDREISGGQEAVFRCTSKDNRIAQLKDNQVVEGQTYHYDKVFDEHATTAEVYTHVGRDAVKNVAAGINGTIFAYGQTSSGKTHTMLGGGDQRGVLEMAAEDIFNQISESTSRDFLLRVSFVEIYNEMIRDLLSDAADTTVTIREDPKKGVYCDAIEIIITDYESIIKALKKGISKRAVEATSMNDTSSRSHTIFKLVVESKESARVGFETEGAVLVASLNLVDLAGSESVRHTGATGQRAKEGGKINQSLLSLSRVIHSLSQPGAHVSFRDSKLTRLLQPSLSGNAKMAVVCCVTPSEKYIEETRSTLQFASRAKLVKTNATVNEVVDDATRVKRLKKELEQLKDKQQRLSSGMSDEEGARIEEEKNDLLARLSALQTERDQQKAQLECLRGLVGANEENGKATSEAEKKRRKKRQRDTWCPGAVNSSPAPSKGSRMSASPLKLLHSTSLDNKENIGDRGNRENRETIEGSSRRSSASTVNNDFFDVNDSMVRESSDTTAEHEELLLLKEKLAARDSEVEFLQEKMSDINNREKESEMRVTDLCNTIHNLEQDLSTLQDIIGGESAPGDQSAVIAALKKDIEVLTKTADSASFLNDQLMSSNETINTLESVIEGLERDRDLNLESAPQEVTPSLSEDLAWRQEMEGTVATMTATIASKETEIARLLVLNAELTERAEAAEEMILSTVSEIDALEASKIEAEERAEKAEGSVRELQVQIAVNLDAMDSAISSAEEARDFAVSALEASEGAAKDAATAAATAVEVAEEARDAAACALETSEAKLLTSEQAQAVDTMAASEEAKAASDLSLAANEELAKMGELMALTSTELATTQERCAELEKEVAEKQASLVELAGELSVAQEKSDAAEEMIISTVAEIDEIEAGKTNAEERADKAENIAKELQDQMATHSTAATADLQASIVELSAAQDREQVLITKCATLEQEKEEVIAKLEGAVAAAEEARDAALSALQMSQQTQAVDTAAASDELKAASDLSLASEKELTSMKELVDMTSAELASTQERCVELEKEVAKKQASLEALGAELSEAREKCEAAEEMIISTAAEIDAFEQSKTEAEERADKAESTVRVLEEQMSAYGNTAADLLAATLELSIVEDREHALIAKCATLEKAVVEKEEIVEELEGALTAAEAARDLAVSELQASESAAQDAVAAVAIAEEARDSAARALEASESAAQDAATAAATAVTAAEEAKVVDTAAASDEAKAASDLSLASEEELTSMKELLDLTAAELTETQEREQAMLTRCAELESEVAEKKAKLEALEIELSSALEKSEEAVDEITAAMDSLTAAEEARDAAVCALETITVELQESKAQSSHELSILEGDRSTMMAALAVKDVFISELEVTSANISSELQKTADSAVERLAVAQKELSDMKVAATSQFSASHLVEAGMSQDGLEAAKKEMDRSVSTINSQLGIKEGEISRLMALTSELSDRAVRAEQIIASSLARESSACDGEEAMKKRINQLSTMVDIVKGERDSACKRLSDSERELRELSGRACVAGEKMEAQLSLQSDQIAKLEAGRGEFSRLGDSIRALEFKVETLKAERDEFKGLHESTLMALQQLEGEMESRNESKSNEQNSGVDALSEQLLVVEKREKLLIATCSAMEQDISEANNRVKKMKEENALVKEEWSRSDETLRLLIEEKHDIEVELEKAVLQVEELTEALLEAETIQSEEKGEEQVKYTAEDFAQKDEEIEHLTTEIELLKAELTAANECIEAEMQLQRDTQEQTQCESAELQARLEIAAQELTAQQRIVDQMKEEERERLCAIPTDDQDSLMVEMNALLESKIEADARADKAESDAKSFQDQLSTYDRNTAEEQEIIMKAAETEMESLRQDREEIAETLRVASLELKQVEDREKLLLTKCATLEQGVAEKEEIVEELEVALSAAEEARDSALSALEASETSAQSAAEAALKALAVARDAAAAAAGLKESSGDAFQSERASMVAALAVKDQRIAHLEVSKLTQEQMAKIKLLKEEHKKSREDVKTMKKQLSQLKKAYDDLKDSSTCGDVPSGSAALVATHADITAAHADIAALNAKLQESVTRLESAQNIVKALKEKIKDCSKQLQEYEAERSAVVKVLESHGIDTACLQQDTSINEDESVLYNDLSDAVAELAEKLSSSKASEKMVEKMRGLQENMAAAQREAEELKALKMVTEKRLEASKAAARGSRAEAATVSAEVDFLREQLQQMTGQLAAAEGKLTGSVDAVSSEVQALEEENIELMKENMELRKETSTYRLEVEKVKAQLIKQTGVYDNKVVSSVSSSRPAVDLNSSIMSVQDENIAPITVTEKAPASTTKSLPAGEGRRTRKAKPLVDSISNEAQGGDAEGGECAQS